MNKIKKRAVKVRFLDHCQVPGPALDAKPVECDVLGYLAHETPTYIVVTSWVAEDDLASQNCENYVVLKSTILEKRFL